MLTPKQITEIEAVYICRNFNTISDDIFVLLIERFYDINLEQFIYLKWLLTRWPLLRKHKNHMPARIVYLPCNGFK
jgi:hypothetical protein